MSFKGVSLLLIGLVSVHCKPLGEEAVTAGTQPAPEDPAPSQSYGEIVQLLQALQNQDQASPSNQQPAPVPANDPFPVTQEPPIQQFSASQAQSTNSAATQLSQSSSSIQQSSSSQVQSGDSVAQQSSNNANAVYQQVSVADEQFVASQAQQASTAQASQQSSVQQASSSNVQQVQQSSNQQQAQQSTQGRAWYQPVPVVVGHQVVPQLVVPVNNQVVDNSAVNAHYKFGFVVDNNIEGNFIQRDEVRANGRVAGVYSYDDGYFLRSVTYVADRNGFRIVKEHVSPSTKRGRLSGNAVVKSYFDNNAYQYGIVRNDLKFKTPQVHTQ